MLETIREYATSQLAEAGETEPARHRHALAFLTLAEREHAITALSRDHDNFRAALDWSLRAGDTTGPRLARALGDFWLGRGYFAEARDWIERALARQPADDQVRADLLRLHGTILDQSGDMARAQAVLSEGLQVAKAAGLPATQARISLSLTESNTFTGLVLATPSNWPDVKRRVPPWRPTAISTAWPRPAHHRAVASRL